MAEQSPSALPSLFSRLVQVFVSPGELFTRLREHPAWAGALVLGGLFVAVSVGLIPGDIWLEFTREQMLEQGREIPPGFGSSGSIFLISSVIGGVVGWFVFAFLLAGIVTLVFAFLLGDEGGYRQYLSVVSHGLIISAVGALATVPLKIAQGDPTLTLSAGTFFAFLGEGYPLRVLRLLDLFGLWGYGVMAIGVSKVDPRRGTGSALVFFYGFALVIALIFGAFGG